MSKRAKGPATGALQPGGSEPRLISKATKKARPAKTAKRGWRPSSFQPRPAKVWMVPRVARRAAGNVMSLARTRARNIPLFCARHDKQDYPVRLKRCIGERDARLELYPNARCHPGVARVERLGSGKQRSGMSVLAETKQGLEHRPLGIERLAPVKALQGCLLQSRGIRASRSWLEWGEPEWREWAHVRGPCENCCLEDPAAQTVRPPKKNGMVRFWTLIRLPVANQL